jgi:ComF family protein
MARMVSRLRRFGNRVLDVLLPPLCLICDEPVAENATLCPACWPRVTFIAPPFCAACGAPFDVPVEEGTLCGRCIDAPPLFASARAAMIYDDFSRGLVLGFKHGDHTYAAKALAAWMQRAGGDRLAACDVIVPVPLHRRRLFARRYNQAALLALQIGRRAQKPVCVDALRRVRATPIQGHMKRKEREDNVRGAFAVAHPAAVAGKAILLVDDVFTTGATAGECAKVLLAAGAARVDVLTLARVRVAV